MPAGRQEDWYWFEGEDGENQGVRNLYIAS